MTRTRSVVLTGAVLLGLLAVSPPAPAAAQTEAALAGASSVDSGDDHTCARLTSGQVRCWGDNLDGQLGNNDVGVDTEAPVTVLNLAGGGPLTGVTAITAGDDHICARLGNGQARCWGDNDNGQLGNNDVGVDSDLPVVVLNAAGTAPLTGVVALTGGDNHTCARLNTDQVRCWGDNSRGQLGNGSTTDADTPVTVKGVGGVGTLTGVSGIDAGDLHTCATLASGQARCWGENSEGQIGDNSTTDRLTPRTVRGTNGVGTLTGVVEIAATTDHTCARLTSGQARCWGDNSAFGQLGTGALVDSLVPRVVRNPADTGALTGVLQIEVSSNATCARVTGGQVRCWGDNGDGEVGDNTIVSRELPTVTRNPADTGPLKNATNLGPGDSHTCTVLANGQVRCWGDNDNGQLGDNDAPNDSGLPVVVNLS